MLLCKMFGHNTKQVGILQVPPPNVVLARGFRCKRCKEEFVRVDGFAEKIALSDTEGLRKVGFHAREGMSLSYQGRTVTPSYTAGGSMNDHSLADQVVY